MTDTRLSRGQNIWWLVAVVASGVSWWTYKGPFRWLAELQIQLFDAYFIQLTFVFTLVLIGAPGALVVRRFERRRAHPATAAVKPLDPAWILVLPALGLLIGGGMYAQARSLRLQTIPAGDLEFGQKAPSRWLEIEGRALTEAAVCSTEGYARECYVPLVSEEWTPVVPVAAFIHLRGDPARLKSGPYKGTVSYTGLPGPVRAVYERSELGTPRDTMIVLDLGHNPFDLTEVALVILWISGLMMPTVAVMLLLQRRRARQVAAVVAVSRARAAVAGLHRSSAPAGPAAASLQPGNPA